MSCTLTLSHVLARRGAAAKAVTETMPRREDDNKWPPKNKDGKQELEIKIGNEHISFEVRPRMPVP